MQVNILEAGACFHPEFVASRKGSLFLRRFPALVVHIDHPRLGHILFDTGYTANFLSATERFPQRLYRWITPVDTGISAKEQLLAAGINHKDVRLIIISHLHADHIAGVRDFPNAELLIHQDAFDQVGTKRGLAALRQGFLPELLPDNFRQRARILAESDFSHFTGLPDPADQAYDVAADGRILLISLPGHSAGQMGLFINGNHKKIFFVADACWLIENLKTFPHPLSRIAIYDYGKYRTTLGKIRSMVEQAPEIDIVPSHCSIAINRIKGGGLLV